MDSELRIELAEEDADGERLDTLTRNFQRELRQLDVDDVSAISASASPPGSKAVDAATVEALLIALGTAAQGLAAVIMMAREWRKRGGVSDREVRLELDGDVLSLKGEPGPAEDRAIALFIERHTPGERTAQGADHRL
jgi:hypothetical protein